MLVAQTAPLVFGNMGTTDLSFMDVIQNYCQSRVVFRTSGVIISAIKLYHEKFTLTSGQENAE